MSGGDATAFFGTRILGASPFQGGNYLGGTVFELTPNGSGGWAETVLHSFGKGADGYQPTYGSLIFDAAGNLYGTTQLGGSSNSGTVFELTPDGSGGWAETLLDSFDATDGQRFPLGRLDLRCRRQSLWYDLRGRHLRPRDGVRADAHPSVYQM